MRSLTTCVVQTFRFARHGRRARHGKPKGLHYVIVAILAASSLARAADLTLVDASERNDRAAVMRLLAKGANPNTAGPDGTTAVMWAASNGDLELVRSLIKAGADVKRKNQFGTSAITEASIIGSAP